jgi:hypothetical protein
MRSIDVEGLNRKIETLAGQVEAMRLFVIASAMLSPDPAKLDTLTKELLDSQRALLVAQPVSEEFLEGLDLAGKLMQQLLRKYHST